MYLYYRYAADDMYLANLAVDDTISTLALHPIAEWPRLVQRIIDIQ